MEWSNIGPGKTPPGFKFKSKPWDKDYNRFKLQKLQGVEDRFATESMNLRELIRALSKYSKEGYMTPSNFPLQKYTPKK
jgi:hypothetical protein